MKYIFAKMYRVSDVHFGARIYQKIFKSGARRTMSKSAVPYLYGAEKTIPIEQLHPFANHPFHVRHDLEMKELMDSIEESGIIEKENSFLAAVCPAIVSYPRLLMPGCRTIEPT